MFDPFFSWLESTTLRTWIVESPSLFAFPGILAAHTIGLGLLVGLTVALDLRLLGIAPNIPPDAFTRFLPVMRFGLWLNVVTGLTLVLAYPTKALTNPIFYLKLTLIGVGVVLAGKIRVYVTGGTIGATDHAPRALRRLAGISLLVWVAVITTGRLLAYTCSRLTVDTLCQ